MPAPSSRTVTASPPTSQRDGLGGVRRAAAVVGLGHGAEGPGQARAHARLIVRSVTAGSGRPSAAVRLTSLGRLTADPLAWLVALEGVPSAYAAARDGIDVMLRDRGLRRTSPGD